ncbi:MAG TPA: MarR family transcriptional regulator [Hyphomonadaceae bacterium]|nr:MarR family transcriptional regulator [Hyphomonadaceae bacterium]
MSVREDTAQLYFRMFTEVAIIAQLSGNRLERVLPEGMSQAQFGVLTHFVRLGGKWSPGRLARAFQVTKGAMTNTLQRLEAQGFVRIEADPKDARGKLAEITEAGRRARDAAVRATGATMAELVALIPASDVKGALPFLERVRQVLDGAR